ncbi:MAG: urease accessory UreF family protein [Pseudomonadota bacterium]
MPTVDPHLTLQTWLSPGYPVSGFAYSHGVEQAIAQGDIASDSQAEEWIALVIAQGSGRNDACLISAAWQGAPIAELARARAVAVERRVEMDEMGAAFARTTRNAYGLDLQDGPYPVVFGQACRALDIPLAFALPAYLNAFAAQMISVCVRLVPLGQTQGQAILARLAPQIGAVARAAEAGGLEDLGSACFASDMAAMAHERLSPRLFRT